MLNLVEKTFIINPVCLTLFGVTNVTHNTNTTGELSNEMKTYYSDYLIDLAEPELVHMQFGQKHPIPKNGGKNIEFRKYEPLEKATSPLTEGVTPDGQKLTVDTVTSTVNQYGGFVTISDVLELTAIDDNIVEATTLIANQAGRTLDTVVRDIITGGTNVLYANNGASRSALIGGKASAPDDNNYLKVLDIKKAVLKLKNMNAPKINGSYVGIIHPAVAFDLTNDPAWRAPKEYCDPKDLYDGEIGMVEGVRFVVPTEAKVFANAGTDWSSGSGQASQRDVYATMIIGANAYGVTDVEGGGLKHIVKQLGSGGTADPLDQRATTGWKAMLTAERLVEEYMVRVESTASQKM